MSVSTGYVVRQIYVQGAERLSVEITGPDKPPLPSVGQQIQVQERQTGKILAGTVDRIVLDLQASDPAAFNYEITLAVPFLPWEVVTPNQIGNKTVLDPMLVGIWVAGSRTVRIDDAGWMWLVDTTQPYTISADGQVLDFPATTKPWTFQRKLGSGQVLHGVWEREETDSGVVWTEEWYYRPDGTYTMQWRADGAFDSEYQGRYTADATEIAMEERRALIIQKSPTELGFELPFGPNFSGTYVMAAGGSSFDLTIGGSTTTYIRQPE